MRGALLRGCVRLALVVLLAATLCLAAAAAAGAPAGMVRLYGRLTDQVTGEPIPWAYVGITDQGGNSLASTTAGADGGFDVTVPAGPSYWVHTCVMADRGDFRVYLYTLPPAEVIPGGAGEVRADIALCPAANLIIQAYDGAGGLMRAPAFDQTTKGYAFATDLGDLPHAGTLQFVADRYALDNGGQRDVSLPAFVVPADRPTRLHVLWTVPGFGEVMLALDNAGAGYSIAGPGGCQALNLNREAAFSEVERLKREMALFTSQGYAISGTVGDEAQAARAALDDGERLLGAKPADVADMADMADMAAAVRCFDDALAHALYGQEGLFLDRAAADIPKSRQGSLRLTIRRPSGAPLAGAAVTYKQTSHDFQFAGSYLTDGWNYLPQVGDRLAEAGFNATAVMLSYKILEPEPGRYDWSYLDRWSGLDTMVKKGFGVHGELAYWANDSPFFQDIMCPSYWRAMSLDQLKQNIRGHFQALAARYGGRIGPWMINEQNLAWSNGVGLTWAQKLDVYGAVMDGLRAGDPAARNIVCSIALPFSWAQDEFPGLGSRARGIAFPAYLDLVRGRGLPIDSIGLEFYHFGVTSDPYAPPGLSLAAMTRYLDLYARYGVPVYVKEFQVPSTQEPTSSWWHRPWDAATQAEFATKFYTLAFSRPQVRGIQWSAFVSDRNTYVTNAGILDRDYQPKPVYYALKDLIASWTTSGSGVTDAAGELTITGYGGDYTVYVSDGARTIPLRAHVTEQRAGSDALTAQLTIAVRVGDPKMTVGGEGRDIDSQGSAPLIRGGRVLVPVRAVVEALGGTISYDAVAQQVTIRLDETHLELWVGRSRARLDGAEVAIDPANPAVTPILLNGRVFLPFRFVGESLGCQIGYDAGVVTLVYGG